MTEVVSDTTDIWKLIFTSLQPQDFGTYSCEASNDLDTTVGRITLSRQLATVAIQFLMMIIAGIMTFMTISKKI